MENELTLQIKEKLTDQKAIPLYGMEKNQVVPFWDWVTIKPTFGRMAETDQYEIRWNDLFLATRGMSEQGFQELCTVLNDNNWFENNELELPARSFIEIWSLAGIRSKQITVDAAEIRAANLLTLDEARQAVYREMGFEPEEDDLS